MRMGNVDVAIDRIVMFTDEVLYHPEVDIDFRMSFLKGGECSCICGVFDGVWHPRCVDDLVILGSGFGGERRAFVQELKDFFRRTQRAPCPIR